jgi:NADP-dependent 3-hydroxy acid dehydrogenase YdfG
MMKRLDAKVAVVTGGTAASVWRRQNVFRTRAREWPFLVETKKLDEAAKMIGDGVLAIQADVAKLADLDKLYAEVSGKLEKIDVLFVNAGTAKNVPLAQTSESTFDEQFDINIKGHTSRSRRLCRC